MMNHNNPPVLTPSRPSQNSRDHGAHAKVSGVWRSSAFRSLRDVVRSRATGIAVLFGILAMVLYSTVSVLQWRRMVTPSWDLAIFTQLAKAYGAGSAPIVNIKGYGFNLLGDHFHPILVLLGPIYAVWPSGLTVMLVQDALLAISVGLFGWFGVRFLGVLRGMGVALAFGLSFGVIESVRVQFHEVAFAMPLLSASLCLLAVGKLRAAVLWAIPLAFVKEDMGVTAAMIGLMVMYRAARGRSSEGFTVRPLVRSLVRGDSAWGLFLVGWGILWSALAVFVIVPSLNPDGRFDYGGSVNVLDAIADPLQSFALMLYPWAKAQTLGLLLVTGALVCLRSPVSFVALPTLVWRFLSDHPGYWEPTWHYNLVIMPVLIAAIFDAALRARAGAPGRWRGGVESMTSWGPVLAGVMALVLVPTSSLLPTLQGDDGPSRHVVQAEFRAMERIPSGASVSSDLTSLAYLVPHHDVRWMGTPGDPAPDYVILNLEGNTWNGAPPRDPTAFAKDHFGLEYREVFREDGVVVMSQFR
ncbi:DUF2079 domain-containing protein [uncultured Kocuria sp.]|uniref:DUF2079 domain-containing protein n=1 Tax=uncultured Kocuria sp. TaxID=259305 RepID=UPI002596C055|nr:DUF2079 domain-containing protein [uncultured Kocuria sp.]MCT1368351.1 DUF2079 domain-containing protein [Rothia sp. p3-SID1597]